MPNNVGEQIKPFFDRFRRIPDEFWRDTLVSPPIVKPCLHIEESGRKKLVCSACGAKTPQKRSPEMYRCRACGQEYEHLNWEFVCEKCKTKIPVEDWPEKINCLCGAVHTRYWV